MMRCCRLTPLLSIFCVVVISAKTARLLGNFRRRPILNVTSKENQLFYKSRHVCSQPQLVRRDVMTVQTYCKATYKQVARRCGYTFCPSFQLIYQIAYRKVRRTIQAVAMKYVCCPGWARNSLRENSCLIPQCSRLCQNGGRCTQPETCTCTKGYTGKACEVDVNECKESGSPCGHKCTNTQGSFVCQCYDGFHLQADRKTCKLDLKKLPEYWEIRRNYEALKQGLEDVQRDMEQKTSVNMSQLMEELQKMKIVVEPTKQTTVQSSSTSFKEVTSSPIYSTSPPLSTTPSTSLIEDLNHQVASLSNQIGFLEESLANCACGRLTDASYRQHFQYVLTRKKRKTHP